jgi:hypothetical protein
MQTEKRRDERQPMCLPCTARAEQKLLGLFWTEDLSESGARLCHGLPVDEAERLRLTMHFPWTGAVTLRADVVHQTERNHTLVTGVRFAKSTRTAHRLAVALQERRERSVALVPASALVVGRRRAIRRALETDLAALGARVAVADFPPDMDWYLGQSGERYAAVYLDHAMVRDNIMAWLDGLAEDFPDVRRVLFTDQPIFPGMARLLGNGSLHAVITSPWSRRYLIEVLGTVSVPVLTR